MSLSPNAKNGWAGLENHPNKAAVERNYSSFRDSCLIPWLSSFSHLDISSIRSERDPNRYQLLPWSCFSNHESWRSSNQGW